MSAQTFVNYWIGQEPTPPSPRLDQMPPQVPVVPLAFVTIDGDWKLDFSFLCTTNPPDVIKGWIKTVRSHGAQVLLSINSQDLANVPDVPAFVAGVADDVVAWGVDGIDLDCEPPPADGTTLLAVTAALRPALVERIGHALITAPIYSPWLDDPDLLKAFAGELDWVTTMDYTPYPGLDKTKDLVNRYVAAIGDAGQVAIGVSCMAPDQDDATPLEDVVTLCGWEPDGGTKRGMMLYTFSYDIKTRQGGGTGWPDMAYTKTILQHLP